MLRFIVLGTHMTPDPELSPTMHARLALLAKQALRYPSLATPGATPSVAELRAAYRDSNALLDQEPVDDVACRALTLPLPGRHLAARCYVPAARRSSVLLAYFHGGGWVVGDLDTHDAVLQYIARELGCTVVSVDYRLAPEHPFPAACDDASDAVRWLHQHRADFGCQQLATAGDSAGGHLAAVAGHECADIVQAMLLLYPVTGRDFDTTSYTQRGAGPGLTAASMRRVWQQFVPASTPPNARIELTTQSTTPATARATVVAAWHDPLYDDALRYAAHLRSQGAEVDELHALEMPHGFIRHWAVDAGARAQLDRAVASFARMCG
jgi:acetyl esterase